MQGILPEEAQGLLQAVLKENGAISDQVETILDKLWQGEKPAQHELDLDITPAEVAAIWSIRHKRPLSVATVRQAILRRSGTRKNPIQPSKEWGSGPTKRRLFRLGDVWEVEIQERAAKSGERP